MDDDHSKRHMYDELNELIAIVRMHGAFSDATKEFIDKHKGIDYVGEFQSALDIQELIQDGLII